MTSATLKPFSVAIALRCSMKRHHGTSIVHLSMQATLAIRVMIVIRFLIISKISTSTWKLFMALAIWNVHQHATSQNALLLNVLCLCSAIYARRCFIPYQVSIDTSRPFIIKAIMTKRSRVISALKCKQRVCIPWLDIWSQFMALEITFLDVKHARKSLIGKTTG